MAGIYEVRGKRETDRRRAAEKVIIANQIYNCEDE